MIITFAGHRHITERDEIACKLREQLLLLISEEEKTLFYLGGYGEFDNLCLKVCRELKKDFPNTELVFVTPYITPNQQTRMNEMLSMRIYDSTIYPPIENTPLRYAISKRNEWMMSNADIVVTYVKTKYGGAYTSLCVARRKGKKIINLSDCLKEVVL